MSCETRIQAMHINGVRFFGSNLLHTSSHSVTDTLYGAFIVGLSLLH